MEISKKSELRAYILNQRKLLDPEVETRMNLEIFNRLLSKESVTGADCVYCYCDCRHEAGTGRILQYLWEQGIPVALPRVHGKEMKFYYVTSGEQLSAGCMGIMEPVEGLLQAGERKAPVITPGLAFDREGYRMGYGGGYYDRFFAEEPDHLKIGIGFGFQLVDRVPRESWDRKLDDLIIAGIGQEGEWV